MNIFEKSEWRLSKTRNRGFKIDKKFHRTIFKFYHFSISEEIIICQYPDSSEPVLYYCRFFSIEEEEFFNPIIYRIIYRISTKFIFKSPNAEPAKSSKFIYKYRFLREFIPDIKRNDILEELGI
jgi:hypothetical protein